MNRCEYMNKSDEMTYFALIFCFYFHPVGIPNVNKKKLRSACSPACSLDLGMSGNVFIETL